MKNASLMGKLPYLRFCIGPHMFQFRALCFGLSSAPQVFTHVMAPISSVMHRHGYRILRYLDDWLVLGSSLEEIVRARVTMSYNERGASKTC